MDQWIKYRETGYMIGVVNCRLPQQSVHLGRGCKYSRDPRDRNSIDLKDKNDTDTDTDADTDKKQKQKHDSVRSTAPSSKSPDPSCLHLAARRTNKPASANRQTDKQANFGREKENTYILLPRPNLKSTTAATAVRLPSPTDLLLP